MRGNATVIRANVPLANMFGYVSQLRSMSHGARVLHHAVRALCRGAAQRRRGGEGEVRLIEERELTPLDALEIDGMSREIAQGAGQVTRTQ